MWTVVYSAEVEQWLKTLTPAEARIVVAVIDRLREQGNLMRMPLSKPLGNGLHELRFNLSGTARRITYTFDEPRRIITLTTFWHQKRTESKEITRARAVLRQYKQDQENLRRKPQ